MKPLILGFTGKKGHGKTTACLKAIEVLEDKGYKVVRINFKDALVHTMRTKLNRTLALLGEHYNLTQVELFEQKPPLVRTLMQEVGTEIYRGFNTDHWILEWYKSVYNAGEVWKLEPKLAIITDDVRFSNEETILKAKGGKLIRIVRNGYEDNVAVTHQSETEMDSFIPDFEISAHDKQSLEDNITACILDHIV